MSKFTLSTIEAIKSFIVAPKPGSKARFTLFNPSTKTHATYQIKRSKKKGDERLFVYVLTGSDNTKDYTFLGTIFEREDCKEYFHGRKSTIGRGASSAKGFDWLTRHLPHAGELPHLEFIPEKRCCRCGQPLTAPKSAAAQNALGIPLGPDCRKTVGA